MNPEDIEYLDAPEGVEATWYEAHGKLYIVLAKDLDDVTRQRYITQAKREHGIEEHRRRVLIPFLPSLGKHATGHSKHATAIAAAGGVVAAGVAAAVVIPVALDNHQEQSRRPPAAAAPAPTRPDPAPPNHPSTPTRPDLPDTRPQQSTSTAPSRTPLVPRHPVKSLVGPHPARDLVGEGRPVPSHPLAPVRNVVRPRSSAHPLIDLRLPRVGVQVHALPSLSVRIRLDLLQPLPRRRP